MKRILVFLLLISSWCQGYGQGIDIRLLEHINGPVSPADQTWRNVSAADYVFITATPAAMLISGLASHNNQLIVNFLTTGSAIVMAEVTTTILKQAIHRQRPYLAHPDLIIGKSGNTDYSFPSGHTSTAFATATSLSLSFPKWYVIAPAFTYATAVGYSRLYLGVHYPSDVFAGAVIGAGSSFLTWKLQKLLNKKYHYYN